MQTFVFSKAFTTRVDPTENVQACAAMFGIGVDEQHEVVLYENLTVMLGPKRLIYITGDSGAGKTCLLRDIMTKVQAHEEFELLHADQLLAAPDLPLVDQFPELALREILHLLDSVGITEPFVWLRKPRELSDGQRYRFLLARMIHKAKVERAGRTPVLCIDEFLAFLDRETARNVAASLRRLVGAHSLCAVVATTHVDIAADLNANATYTMRLNLPVDVTKRILANI